MCNSIPIQSTCATIAALMGIEAPSDAFAPCDLIVDYVRKRIGKPERIIMYNPDAIALHLWQKYPHLYTPEMDLEPLPVPIYSVLPSVTPVCFASITNPNISRAFL